MIEKHFLKKYKIKWTPTDEPAVSRGYKKLIWCVCECGVKKLIWVDNLKSLKSKGCHKCTEAKVHGQSKDRIHVIWKGMKHRCTEKVSPLHRNYGQRGIRVCKQWQKFIPFRDWAFANGYKENLTIDRIDYNGDYTPSNCRWVTQKVQANNTRRNVVVEYQGRKQNLTQWANELGFHKSLLLARYRLGFRDEKLFGPLIKMTNTYRGVTYDKSQKKWRARKRVGKKLKHVGWFLTELEALNALRKLIL